MKTATIAQAKAKLDTYVDQAESDGPVAITRNGKTVAVLIAPTDEEDLESLLLARSPKFIALIERSRKSVREGKVIPAKEFWKQVRERAKPREKTAGRRSRRAKAPS